MLLFALSVTRIVFGELRTQELNSAKDKFWNFVFYKVTKKFFFENFTKLFFKFIFVFGVINVQKADQVMAWAAWFSILSFLVVMTKISKLRYFLKYLFKNFKLTLDTIIYVSRQIHRSYYTSKFCFFSVLLYFCHWSFLHRLRIFLGRSHSTSLDSIF